MNNLSRQFMATFIFVLSLNIASLSSKAQSGQEDPDAPIDGGVTILLAAGVGYGIKKAKDQRKINKSKSTNFDSTEVL